MRGQLPPQKIFTLIQEELLWHDHSPCAAELERRLSRVLHEKASIYRMLSNFELHK